MESGPLSSIHSSKGTALSLRGLRHRHTGKCRHLPSPLIFSVQLPASSSFSGYFLIAFNYITTNSFVGYIFRWRSASVEAFRFSSPQRSNNNTPRFFRHLLLSSFSLIPPFIRLPHFLFPHLVNENGRRQY